MKERLMCPNSMPPHSIMNNAHRYSELSWPADYERFENKLKEKFKENWKEHMTDQWGKPWHKDCWSTLKDILHQKAGVQTGLITSNFIPKTGPYTGVGYFMEVVWG